MRARPPPIAYIREALRRRLRLTWYDLRGEHACVRVRYSEPLSDVQRARTFVPTDVMTAIAATMIRPAIRAYSRTSPPASSTSTALKRFHRLFMLFMTRHLPIASRHDCDTTLSSDIHGSD